jgi:hypothetical protein
MSKAFTKEQDNDDDELVREAEEAAEAHVPAVKN